MNREKALEMRNAGLNTREIAEALGVSRQRVCQYFTGGDKRYVPVRGVVYAGLKRWLLTNHIGLARLVVMLGGDYHPQSSQNIANKLRGKYEFRISEIRKLLELSGLCFEEAFALEADSDNSSAGAVRGGEEASHKEYEGKGMAVKWV